jgi:hypothetical protein
MRKFNISVVWFQMYGMDLMKCNIFTRYNPVCSSCYAVTVSSINITKPLAQPLLHRANVNLQFWKSNIFFSGCKNGFTDTHLPPSALCTLIIVLIDPKRKFNRKSTPEWAERRLGSFH